MAREAIEKTTLKNPFVSCKNFSSNWFVTEDQARKDFKDLENTETAYTFQALLMYMQMMGMGGQGAGAIPGGIPAPMGQPQMGGMPPHMVRGRGAP